MRFDRRDGKTRPYQPPPFDRMRRKKRQCSEVGLTFTICAMALPRIETGQRQS
jgi:hypothetical protein